MNQISYETELYTYMKRMFSSNYRLTDRQISVIEQLLEKHYYDSGLESYDKIRSSLLDLLNNLLNETKYHEYERLIMQWEDSISLSCFIVGLFLIKNKSDVINAIQAHVEETTSDEQPLSLKYDNITVNSVYISRIVTSHAIKEKLNEYLVSETDLFITAANNLIDEDISIKYAYNPIISESLKQGAISTGGSSYENLIMDHLLNIGLDIDENEIEKFIHEDTGSIENDIKFKFDSVNFGISAKKTLRERYKQYVNLVEQEHETQVFMCITLGTDLTEEKAKTIRRFGVYIFVSPEVYNARTDLQQMDGVYNVYDLDLKLLTQLADSY